MAKIVILGDQHFGMRNDSIPFYENHNRFYQEVFFPYLLENNIKDVFQLGDVFDRRKFINFLILQRAKEDFFSFFGKNKIVYHTIPGNHDIYFRNTISVNSLELLLADVPYVDRHDIPITIDFDGCYIDFIPWICAENEKNVIEFIKGSPAEICMGHFELTGFEMDKGNVCYNGMDRSMLKKYEMVFSGHFHHRSTDGQILYVGTPGQMTFADVDCIKGFHVFDTETRLIEFVANPFIMFHKFVYDDTILTFDDMNTLDFEQYRGTYIKIIILNKSQPYLFDKFMESLNKVSPLDITIQEDSYIVLSGDEESIQSENTLDILKDYIDDLELEIDKDILYNKMHEMFIESQHLEQI